MIDPAFTEPELFSAYDEGYWTAQIDVGVVSRRIRGGNDDPNIIIFQPIDRARRVGLGDRNGKQGADACANCVRVVEIGPGVTDNDSRRTGSVGGAQDRSEIPGLLYCFGHEKERIGAARHIGQFSPNLTAERQQSLRAIAVGDFLEYGGGTLDQPAPCIACALQQGRFILSLKELRAKIEIVHRMSIFQRSEYFTISLDDEDAPFIPAGALP